MANLCAGICSSSEVEKGPGYRGVRPASSPLHAPDGVAALPWNQRQLSPGIGGSFAMESVAAFVWNRWQLCRGIGGRIHLESVAALAWNTHRSAHIRQISVSVVVHVGFQGLIWQVSH